MAEENIEKNELEDMVKPELTKLRRSCMLMGAQAVSTVVISKINDVVSKSSKVSYRDYERLVKDIYNFCKKGLDRKVNADGSVTEGDTTNV